MRAGGRSSAQPPALFEFNVAGAGPACACTNPSIVGTGGTAALSMTRTGTATCLKSTSLTAIANGDMVTCAGNQPRLQPPGDGSGVVGYLMESSRTNLILQSGNIADVAWSTENLGTSAPTLTANFAVAPDGTTTATRMQLQATTAGQDNIRFQSLATGPGYTGTVFVKGNGTSGTIDLCAGTAGSCVGCNYVSTAWMRCSALGAGGTSWIVGNATQYNGGTARAAADVLVWGAQSESGTYATSYIPTTAASVTRNADSVLSGTLPASVGTSMSMAVSVTPLGAASAAGAAFQLGTVAPNLASIGKASDTTAAFTLNATTTNPVVSAMGTGTHRGALADAAGTRSAFWDGSSVSAPAASMGAASTAVSIGLVDAVVTRGCLDNSTTRCR